MSSVFTVIKEQINSMYLIQRLAIYEVMIANRNNYLGFLWEIINPLIQISIYWFVFGYGIESRSGVDGIPYLPWMLSGITVWFFINQSLLHGSKSIYTRIRMISKMSFPMSAIPTYVIISKLYHHLVLIGIMVIILYFHGFQITLYHLQLPYFIFATIVFLFSISLITSTLSTIVRDVQMIVQAVLRLLIYVSAILWVPTSDRIPEIVQVIMKLNPIYYIVEGYRHSLLSTSWYVFENGSYTLYFWGLTLFLLAIGSILHLKFRDHFVDFL
jgi:teichoic acid transport system permease protein